MATNLLPGFGPGEYHCSCKRGGTIHRTCASTVRAIDQPLRRRFVRPITGRLLTASAGSFDIYGPMLGTPTWLAYPIGSDRKVRRRLDQKRRKAARKRKTT